MILYRDIQQGSAAWLELRAGIPTASNFHKILTPTGKPSTSAEGYLHSLLAERMLGRPLVEHVTMWMDRGRELEAEAVDFYSFTRDQDTERVGFITNDAGTIGASPDRLVGDAGLLEIKVPKESTHVGYLLKGRVEQEYMPQIQGQLWIAERQWIDLLAFHPELPPALVRVDRDEEFIARLATATTTFTEWLEAMSRQLVDKGWITGETWARYSAAV